jgi:hypothetical protein
MSKRLSTLIIVLICLCIGCVLGYTSGKADSDIVMKKYVLDSNANLLTQHILCLAKLRTNRIDEAAVDMEQHIDSYTRQLSMSAYDRSGDFHAERIPLNHLRALKAAKIYAAAGYRDAFAEDTLFMLDKIDPVIAVKDRFPAMQELQKQSQE